MLLLTSCVRMRVCACACGVCDMHDSFCMVQLAIRIAGCLRALTRLAVTITSHCFELSSSDSVAMQCSPKGRGDCKWLEYSWCLLLACTSLRLLATLPRRRAPQNPADPQAWPNQQRWWSSWGCTTVLTLSCTQAIVPQFWTSLPRWWCTVGAAMMKDIFAKLALSKCESCQHCISRSCSTAVQSTKQFWIGVLYSAVAGLQWVSVQ